MLDTDYLQLAARLVTGTLLGEVRRADGPGGAIQGTVDPERIAGTSLLAGQKVFGPAYARDLVEDAVRWAGADVRSCLDRLVSEPIFTRVKAGCTAERKDALILAALIALELNIDDIGAELLKLRAFGHRLYDTPVESDRRLILYGEAGSSLYPRAIALANEIDRDLRAASAPASPKASVSAAAAPKPASNVGLGLAILIGSALVAMGAIAFGARNIEDPPAWLALGGAALSIAFYFGVYRGFRLLTGTGRWASVALTVFGFPALFGGLLFLIAEFLPIHESRERVLADRSTGGAGGIARTPGAYAAENDTVGGGEEGPQDIDNGAFFSGLNADNTSAADLDELVEYW
ncbi:hypothetical protein [Hyphococcus luteus]|uniref:Uncharacterized protein n=1 Tax=Hyphococcus luteus TaxID=2058213 RepID=A0A2S7K717_9PROT|nr:hypothetical protein [Marinicaulis flavus]PQA88287.1 hypothetical protein CW354_08285 [Marinicaulis flavus]